MSSRFELIGGTGVPPSTDTLLRLQDLAPHFEVVRELGRGGTSIVYQAREKELGRDVAIKVVRPTYLDDAEAVARLAREAKLVALLRHPNIVPLFGTRHLRDGSLALVMQYVPGRTLKQAIREDGPLPVATAARVLRDVAQALHYAHTRHGIIHRDIKPENIYLDGELDRALLADFGIARAEHSDSSLTLVGAALGTPAYMSPEQVDGLHLDARSDLYSLGLVAWEMLTGQQPWAGQSLYAIIYKQKHEELPPLSQFREDVPPQLQQAIDGLLRKEPRHRFPDVAPLLDLLSPILPVPAAAPRLAPRREPPQTTPADDSLTVHYRRDALAASDGAPPRRASTAPPASVPPRSSWRRPVRWIAAAAAVLALFMGMDNAPRAIAAWRASAPPASRPSAPAPAPAATAPRAAARILLLAGEAQQGPAGAPLPVPLAVQVEDSLQQPVEGVTVRFSPADGNGSVTPAEAVTGPYGSALATWTLGPRAGPQELTATVAADTTLNVLFRAEAGAATPARLVQVPGDQPSDAERQPITVRVEDEGGNPVAGARVRFQVTAGDGTLEPATAIADEGGLARTTWSRGSGTGAQAVRASVPGSPARIPVTLASTPARPARATAGVVAGGTHTCALDPGGTVQCWGGNDGGQLGTGTSARSNGIERVRTSLTFSHLAAGMTHSCGLDSSGAAHCWGSNYSGQLGTGDRTNRSVPTPVRGVELFATLTAGLAHTCALNEGSRAWCWGAGGNGQLGDGSGSDRNTPVRVAGDHRFDAITAGWRHTCGLAGGAVWCWGMNRDGQIGDGTRSDRAVPRRVQGEQRFTAVTAGAAHSCALTAAGAAYCWGQNQAGQLGNGGRVGSTEPVRVAGDVAFASILAGAVHTCALTASGEAYCWGRNNSGQLGTGDTQDASVPTPVAGELRFASLSASGSHTCGRTRAGEQYCWGYNLDGQLGDGTRNERVRPTPVRPRGR